MRTLSTRISVTTIPISGLCLTALALSLACGGARTTGQTDSTTPPPPARVSLGEMKPFWLSDNPERPGTTQPSSAQPLNQIGPQAIAIRLSDAQIVQAKQRMERGESASSARPMQKAGPAPLGIATPTRIVTGLCSGTFHRETGTEHAPLDLTGEFITAMVPDGAGGLRYIAGVGHSDGTFSIPAVPVGKYWLCFGGSAFYFWTDSDHVEWVDHFVGRKDGFLFTRAPTPLVMDVKGLSSWQASDLLQWTDPNQGWGSRSIPLGHPNVSGAPLPGDTSLRKFTIGFQYDSGLVLPLLDAGKGDRAFLNQLTSRESNGEVYQALKRTWALPPLTLTPGTTTGASGGFEDVPQSGAFHLGWNRNLYAAMTLEVNPSAVVSGSSAGLWADPMELIYGLGTSAFNLLQYQGAGATSMGDLSLGELPYGNPYPSAWNLLAETTYRWNVSYLAPGALTPVNLRLGAYTATSSMPTETSPLTPTLSPVQNPQINGLDLMQNQLAVGTTPTLSWDPPRIGAATGYFLDIRQLRKTAGGSAFDGWIDLFTDDTRVTIPPGLLVAGNAYVITITAISNPGVSFKEYPFTSSFPMAAAPMASAIVVP